MLEAPFACKLSFRCCSYRLNIPTMDNPERKASMLSIASSSSSTKTAESDLFWCQRECPLSEAPSTRTKALPDDHVEGGSTISLPHTTSLPLALLSNHSANSITPPGPYRVPQYLWRITRFQPHAPLFSLPVELWLEIILYLDIRSTEQFLSAFYFLLRFFGILPPASDHTAKHLLAWLSHGGALYEILTRYPYYIAEDIFSHLRRGQDKVNLVLALYRVDKKYHYTCTMGGYPHERPTNNLF